MYTHTKFSFQRERGGRKKGPASARRARPSAFSGAPLFFSALPRERKEKKRGRKSLFFTSGDYREDNGVEIRATEALHVGGRQTNLLTPAAKLLINVSRVNAPRIYCLHSHIYIFFYLPLHPTPASLVLAKRLRVRRRAAHAAKGSMSPINMSQWRWPQLSFGKACFHKGLYMIAY